PGFDFYGYVDSIAQLRNLETYLPPLHHPLKLLIEAGTPGGRTGLRTLDEARALAAAIASADPARVRFAGVSMFEGAAPGLDKGTGRVDTFARFVVDVVNALPPSLYAGLPEFILSGGGSSYFDIVAERFRAVRLDIPVRVVLRSGCYVTHDSGSYDRAQEQAKADTHRHDHLPADRWPALEAWAYVQSVPEKGLAFLTMGKRDIPYDSGLPVPIKRYRPGAGFLPVGTVEIFATNDQHAYVRLGPDADWQVGDLIASGVSHPCTAFDKWRFIPIVDDDYAVIDGVLTFF
ncbi:MAG TPA: amino acid aldolase, partial [Devosia sp.]|nr:amino acid aldolase [Devosia sp.]